MRSFYYGWIVVAATFWVLFAGFGVVYSFGAFFLALSAEFDAGRAAIASVFSYAVFTLFMTGALSGIVADRAGPKLVMMVGVLAIAGGLLGAAHAGKLWQVVICYTFGVGVGVGCVYVPAISAVQRWFDTRRGFASGIAVTGIGVGTLAMPILAGTLLEITGWRTVFMLFALGVIVIGGLAIVFIEADPAARGLAPDGGTRQADAAPALPPNGRLRVILKSAPFVQLYLASAILSVPVFIPFVHLAAYAEDMGIGRPEAVGILGLIGLGSTFGRFLIGGLADRLGRRRGLILMFIGIAAAYGLWLAASGIIGLSAFAILFGTCYGGYVALSPALLADYFAGPKLSSVIGLQYTAAGFGSLLGPIIAGMLFDASGTYTAALVIGAACSLAACYLIVRMPEPAPRRG